MSPDTPDTISRYTRIRARARNADNRTQVSGVSDPHVLRATSITGRGVRFFTDFTDPTDPRVLPRNKNDGAGGPGCASAKRCHGHLYPPPRAPRGGDR
jgi:hypothetical protein